MCVIEVKTYSVFSMKVFYSGYGKKAFGSLLIFNNHNYNLQYVCSFVLFHNVDKVLKQVVDHFNFFLEIVDLIRILCCLNPKLYL